MSSQGGSGGEGVPFRTVTLARPWAWCWFPVTAMITEDPDVLPTPPPRRPNRLVR
jgi:hypothetical protein